MTEELRGTQASYRQVAAEFARVHRGRSGLEGALAAFVAQLPPKGLVVDVGCGPGYETAVLRSHGLQVVGLDYSPEMMRAGGQAGPFVQGDMRFLPLAAGKVAGLWVMASLLHLPRTAVPATLTEFWRVLQPGGVVYLAVKQGEGEEWTAVSYNQPAPRFFTYWQAEGLTAVLQNAGFTILHIETQTIEPNTWLSCLAQKPAHSAMGR